MNAKQAHQLQQGDFVVVAFSNSHRKAQIMRIDWPYFWVCTTLASGEIREQRSRYQALTMEPEYVRKYGDYNR